MVLKYLLFYSCTVTFNSFGMGPKNVFCFVLVRLCWVLFLTVLPYFCAVLRDLLALNNQIHFLKNILYNLSEEQN